MHKQKLWVHHWRQDTLRRNWCWMSTSTTSRFKCVSATAVNQTQRLCVFTDQTVCTALPTFRPYTTIWGHYEWSNIFAPIWNFFKLHILALKETYLKTKRITLVHSRLYVLNTLCPFTIIWAHENDSIANIFHLAQYQNNFVSWVGFCLSPHVFFISQKECLITYLHESCWMFGYAILGQKSSPGSTLGGAAALGVNEVQRVKCTQTWGVKDVNFLGFCRQPAVSQYSWFKKKAFRELDWIQWIGYLLPRHPRSRGSAWSSACAQPKWSLE